MMFGGIEPIIGYVEASTAEEAVIAVTSQYDCDPDDPDIAAIFEGHIRECPIDGDVLLELIEDEKARLRTLRDWHSGGLQIGGSVPDFLPPPTNQRTS